jgi:hypothetical protein
MSPTKPHERTGNVVTGAWRRARETTVRLQPAADKIMPLAKNAGTAARHQTDRTRAWAAPQVEKAGQVVQESIAPKVSSLLSAAARRLEPDEPRRRRWRKVAGVSAAATAAASALAAAVRSRRKASAAAAPEDLADGGSAATAQTAPAPQTAPTMETRDGRRSPSGDIAQGSEAPTP